MKSFLASLSVYLSLTHTTAVTQCLPKNTKNYTAPPASGIELKSLHNANTFKKAIKGQTHLLQANRTVGSQPNPPTEVNIFCSFNNKKQSLKNIA